MFVCLFTLIVSCFRVGELSSLTLPMHLVFQIRCLNVVTKQIFELDEMPLIGRHLAFQTREKTTRK